MSEWVPIEFHQIKVGDYVRLERPELAPHPDDADVLDVMPEAAYEGRVDWLNPRGEVKLEGHFPSFLMDAVMGDWFYSIFKKEASDDNQNS